MQLCLGATYSWSVFVAPLKSHLNISQTMAQMPFSIFYFVFPFTMIFSGFILNKIGPRKSAVIGGLLFGSGWMVSYFGGQNYLFTIIGNGFLAGFGAGLAYIVPISTCIKWFPKNKGLVTGFAVAGFGGGAALVSQIAGFMVKSHSPFFTLFFLGVIFTIITVLSGINMTNPPSYKGESKAERLFDLSILRNKIFWILYFAMFAGLAAGFAVNGNLKELYHTSTVAIGVFSVSMFAIMNAAGRIIWGAIFDKVKSSTAIMINLFFQVIVLALAKFILKSDFSLVIFAAIVGFNYGGVLVLYAGSTARIWGAASMGKIYGLLFSSNIPGAVAPLYAGFVYDKYHSFNIALFTIAILMFAAVLLIYVNRENIDKSVAEEIR